MNHPAIFFISSGRSGTQWLCDVLGRVYADSAEVTHEPLKRAYWPKRFLRHSGDYPSSPYFDELDHHMRHIETVLEHRTYIETGWPCFPAIPFLKERFGSRFKLVQLLRNPINAAASLVTHNYYSPELKTEVVLHGQLEPFDPGTVLEGWADRWTRLSSFEKCLFHWTEIHNYAEEIRQEVEPERFLRITSEELFSGREESFQELTRFLELPYRPDFCASAENRVDKYRGTTKKKIRWEEVFRHRDVVSLANSHGYDLEETRNSDIGRRYLGPPWHVRAMRRLRGLPARLKRKYLGG